MNLDLKGALLFLLIAIFAAGVACAVVFGTILYFLFF